MNLLQDILSDYTLRNVALGSIVLGIVSGVLGSFAVLRRQGLMGDALSHAALPGVCLAFLLTNSKQPYVLMMGAAVTSWLAMLAIIQITKRTRVDMGSALGIVLTVFFGLGVVLLTVIQKGNNANQAGLDKFLFGQAAALTQEQIISMSIIGGLSLIFVKLCYKEFKLVTFDAAFANTIGYNTNAISIVLTGLLVTAIVIGLNTVGVILMSAMLVAPAVAARQWTHSLAKMLFISAAVGATSGLLGAIASVTIEGVPTGPAIVIILSSFVAISILFGTANGLILESVRRKRWLANE